MSVSKTQLQEFVRLVDRISPLLKSLDLELLKLGTLEKPEAGFAFVHKDFTIKAIFKRKGINWQSNKHTKKCYSVVNKLKKSIDLNYLYAFVTNII